MVELVDTRDLKSRALRGVWVQVPLLVLKSSLSKGEGLFCYNYYNMVVVYILFSKSIDKFYIGSCKNLNKRLEDHKYNKYSKGFTRRAMDWELYFSIDKLEYQQARKIEQQIKGMKSRNYIENLVVHPRIAEKLLERHK